MSAVGEKALIAHLTDPKSLDFLAHEGMPPELIPTEALRPVYLFALHYFYEGGRDQAPSEEAIRTEFGDVLDDEECTLGDPGDTIEWAVEDLRGSWLYTYISSFNKRFADAMAKSTVAERHLVVADFSSQLAGIVVTLERASASVDMREGIDQTLLDYREREATQGLAIGCRFGVPEIDAFTSLIHPGELAVLAGGPKAGKSLWMAMLALRDWQAGRTPVLFTLEISVAMMLDRIACMATNTSLVRWSRGQCTDEEKERVQTWIEESVHTSDRPLWVLQPELGQRTVEAMVQTGRLHGMDTLLIDQLTFMELPDPRKPKTERIGDALHTLKGMISTGRERVPCVLAHQVSRDGVKMAEKVGYLEMYHMADSAEVERTADWVFGLYRSVAERLTAQAKFQTLAARRADPQSWHLTWDVDLGVLAASRPFVPGAEVIPVPD